MASNNPVSETVREAFGSHVGTTQPDKVELTMTSADRCDAKQCGAQAYVRVLFATGTLQFCGHHFAENEAIIQPHSIAIHDERVRLTVPLSSSPL